MGAVEQAVDAAANFLAPFLDVGARHAARDGGDEHYDNVGLVREAVQHLQSINTADLAAEPNAPYDASLAGVVYGLLDLITSLGVLPYLSHGVAFSQRPRSVLIATFNASSQQHVTLLSEITPALLSILQQDEGTGLQPLVTQRSLPDIISALAELALSPCQARDNYFDFEQAFNNLFMRTPTSRLLPILTSFLQQPLPPWLKPRMGRELATIPIRSHGVRHIVEFLSLSYLSKSSSIPQEATGPQSSIPIPLEAVTQAAKLLVTPPNGTSQDEWIRALESQLWSLLDGTEGRELSRAAGQIIAGGILSKKSTGAPGTTGWNIFAQPILDAIKPNCETTAAPRHSTNDMVLTQDQNLLVALKRLAVITTSYSHAGTIKRLIGPLLLPLWALLNYALSKRSLDKVWSELPRNIISRYMAIACDPKQIDAIATSLFWDGPPAWTLGPGTKGGIELRMRQSGSAHELGGMESILSRISDLNGRVHLLVSLLADSNVSDDVAGLIFLQVTRRWLNTDHSSRATLLLESDDDPLIALTDAKLSEALALRFKDQFARSPQHIFELMSQLLHNYIAEHRTKSESQAKSHKPSRANLGSLVDLGPELGDRSGAGDTSEDDLVTFAISTINTLVATPDFKRAPTTDALLSHIVGDLQYLADCEHKIPVSSVILNSARRLLQVLNPPALDGGPGQGHPDIDPLASDRSTLQAALEDIVSPEAPNRTWALSTIHRLIQNSLSFPIIDVPATAYLLLSASLADPESYVHSAAIPVLVSLALNAPHPTIKILVDAFQDVEERSLSLLKGRMTDEKEKELQESLDYRLRVGEVLNNILRSDAFWHGETRAEVKHTSIKHIASACLSLASRRGQRSRTQSSRQAVSLQIMQQQEEAEAAWGGSIPNILEPDSEASTADLADYEALNKIVKGWEDTGVEEDVRIRASAMSIFGTLLEKRIGLVRQVAVDAGLQIVLLVLTMETAETFFILRRAAVLVAMRLLKALDELLDAGEDTNVNLGMRQQDEVERVLRWVRDEDGDDLVRDHAANVVEGLETLRMKKLYKIRDDGRVLGPDLGLVGGLRGLSVRPDVDDGQEKRRLIVEEIE
ncbi:hypothetical protein SVAN01_08965 [Stagonosporopsis vannaccii]|nr:hypothetical protein SVAN01_08965 [Stagonosporopsis vannaccii]